MDRGVLNVKLAPTRSDYDHHNKAHTISNHHHHQIQSTLIKSKDYNTSTFVNSHNQHLSMEERRGRNGLKIQNDVQNYRFNGQNWDENGQTIQIASDDLSHMKSGAGIYHNKDNTESDFSNAQHLVASATRTLTGHDERVQCVSFGFDSNNFITAGHDSRILIWCRSYQISKLVGIVELSSKFVMSCDISPYSSIIAAGGLNNCCSLYLYHPSDPVVTKPVREFTNSDYMLSSCKFLSNSTIICSHGNKCFLHDVAEQSNENENQSLQQFNCHRGQISSIDVFENYPNNFMTCSSDKFVKLWDVRSRGCKMKQRNISEVNCIKICRLRPNLFASSLDYTITLSDIRYPTPLITFRASCNIGEITNIEISNCGRYIFATDDKGIFAAYDLLNIESTNGSFKLLNMLNQRMCMSMSPDGQCFVIGTSDSDVYLSQVINKFSQ
ncbi:MAG: G protein subunit beta [Marteilia pararefringens]